ncbi:MAG: hypothetical protein ING19_08745 [Azospirillum sp.]|nr:hypothetical protein [Azospirillum sp.]
MKTLLKFVDTETTGFDPSNGDRLIELGVVGVLSENDAYRKAFHRLWRFDPARWMPAEAFAVHGLSTAYLSRYPRFADVAGEIAAEFGLSQTPIGAAPHAIDEFFEEGIDWNGIEETVFIAHNASFDHRFIAREFELAGYGRPPNFRDSLDRARRLFPDGRQSLDALSKRFSVGLPRNVHGALIDAAILSEIWKELDLEESRRRSFDLETDRGIAGRVDVAGILAPKKLRRFEPAPVDLERHEAGVAALPNAMWKS